MLTHKIKISKIVRNKYSLCLSNTNAHELLKIMFLECCETFIESDGNMLQKIRIDNHFILFTLICWNEDMWKLLLFVIAGNWHICINIFSTYLYYITSSAKELNMKYLHERTHQINDCFIY